MSFHARAHIVAVPSNGHDGTRTESCDCEKEKGLRIGPIGKRHASSRVEFYSVLKEFGLSADFTRALRKEIVVDANTM